MDSELCIEIDGAVVHTFKANQVVDDTKQQEEAMELAASDRFSFQYTGRHDHGKLPAPTPNPPIDALISFMRAAKKSSNTFLTEQIDLVKMQARQPNPAVTVEEPKQKQPKLE